MKSFKISALQLLRIALIALLFFGIAPHTLANHSPSDDMLQKLLTVGRIQRCVEIAASRPDSIQSQSTLALANYTLGHYQDTISAVNKIFSSDEKNHLNNDTRSQLLILSGLSYYNLGSYDKALADLNNALKIPGCPPEVIQSRALVYDKLGDKIKAAQDRAANDEVAFQDLFEMMRLESYGVPFLEVSPSATFPGKGNLENWQQSIKMAQEARLLEAQNELTKAIDEYKSAIDLYAYDPGLYASIGLCYLTRGMRDDRAKSIAALRQALTLDDSNWQIWGDLGSVLYNPPAGGQSPQQNAAQLAEGKNAFQTALSKSKDIEPLQKQRLLECIKIASEVPSMENQLKKLEEPD